MVISPTNSYEVTLPDDVQQGWDETVVSFWRKGSNCALQVSSFVRSSGKQVSAKGRLADRMKSMGGDWVEGAVDLSTLNCEIAVGTTVDKEEGFKWTHVYLVWPDLTVYATLSRPVLEPPESEDWAIEGLRSIRRR